jgi:hypothetical protein
MLSIVNVILGGALLVSGRKLFWLFVAAGGFLAGVLFATKVTRGPEWLTILIGIAVGIAFAVLAMFLKSFAIGMAGFFLGGSVLSGLAGAFGIADGRLSWVIYIVGVVIGILLVGTLFDWALIVLSAFGGASLLLEAFDFTRGMGGLVFVVLLITGISIQAATMQKEKRPQDD